MSHNNLGVLFLERGDPGPASEEFRAALALWEKLAAERPDHLTYREDLASTHNNLALAAAAAGDRDGAAGHHEEAIALREALVRLRPGLPKPMALPGGMTDDSATPERTDGGRRDNRRRDWPPDAAPAAPGGFAPDTVPPAGRTAPRCLGLVGWRRGPDFEGPGRGGRAPLTFPPVRGITHVSASCPDRSPGQRPSSAGTRCPA
jgi:hypothetical protein